MFNNNKTRTIIIIILVVCLMGLTIAYAVMSDKLKISGVANVGKSEWKIHFDNLKAPTITGSAEKGTATLDSSKTTLTVSDGIFKVPGDKITYVVDVVNEGDIDAEVEIVSTNIGKCEATDGSDVEKYCDKIKAELVYLDTNEEVKVKDELNAGESKTLKFTISYDENRDLTSVPNTSIMLEDIISSITYTMKTDNKGSDDTPKEESDILCKRATTLHTETCLYWNTNNWCEGVGYSTDDTVTYGNLGTSGTLTSGDAFDCDVNGDGVYDSEKERFYYVSDYYDASTKTFDNNYAALIYYNNIAGGEPSNTTVFAYDSEKSSSGPLTAVKELPTTSQWSNVKLKNTTRTITEPGEYSSWSTEFSYAGYAARLITAQEIDKGCNSTTGQYQTGELDSCLYLFEKTNFADYENNRPNGYWLENGTSYGTVYATYSRSRDSNSVYSNETSYGYTVRPAIDVAKTNISY